MGKEKRMKVLSFLEASHPVKFLLKLPLQWEYLIKSFHIAESNRSQSRRFFQKSQVNVHLDIKLYFFMIRKNFCFSNIFLNFFLNFPNFFLFLLEFLCYPIDIS